MEVEACAVILTVLSKTNAQITYLNFEGKLLICNIAVIFLINLKIGNQIKDFFPVAEYVARTPTLEKLDISGWYCK